MSKKNLSILSLLLAFVMAISLCLSSAAIGEGKVDPSVSADLRAACEEGKDLWFGINGKPYDREAALERFRAAAEGGYADAYFYLGKIAIATPEEGRYQTAMGYYEKGAELGSMLCMYGQGSLYRRGWGVELDYAKAMSLFEKAVDGGCAEANAGIAELYLYGLGVEQDGEKAVAIAQKALTGEDIGTVCNAMFILESAYENGIGVEKDAEQALGWYQKAAETGIGAAYANLGTAYLYGTIAEKDEAEAVKWLEMAAEKGYPYRLAECYYNGEGVDCDYQKALALYQQTLYSNAANSYGANPAYQRIGYMYYEGLGVKYDEAEALKWYERGISDGDPACMIQTAYSYRNGIGTDADMGKAMALYEAAAEKGQTGYFLEIGDLYLNGDSVPRDVGQAIAYYEKAIERGNLNGYARLGQMYLKGKGIDADIDRAIAYYEEGVEKGNAACIEWLAHIYLEGMGVEPDTEKGIALLEQGVGINDDYCIEYLGWIYAYGKYGIASDTAVAFALFEKGTELGSCYCYEQLGNFYEGEFDSEKDLDRAIECYRQAALIAERTNDQDVLTRSMERLEKLGKNAKKITINEKNVTLLVGASPELTRAQLTHTVTPEDCVWQDVLWASYDPKIAKVNQKGVVQAIAPGKATIVAVSRQPGDANVNRGQIQVVVSQAVESIETETTELTVAIGKNGKIKTTVLPENAGNRKLTWFSENEEIATVKNGQVTGKAPGVTVITAKATDGSDVSAAIRVTVIRPVKKIAVAEKNVTPAVGESVQLTVTVMPEDATDRAITWTSGDETVAFVDENGTITAVDAGKCVITGLANDGSGAKVQVKVTVK